MPHLDFMRLRRLTKVALEQGSVTRELETARREHLPTFTQESVRTIVIVL